MKFIVTSLLLLLVLFQLEAQNITIKGTITTEDGEALPFANVYLNNSSIGASADLYGNYEFTVDLEGTHKFICSYVGFETLVISKELGEQAEVIINFQLKEIIASLDQVVVKAKKARDWERNLKKFENHFFGPKRVEKKCKIINPYVLDFDILERSVLQAEANEPVVIENRFLGYEITINLESYWAVLNTEQQGYAGYLYFKKLESESLNEAESWNENRTNAYFGSINHFLRSLAMDSLEENGFQIYLENKKIDELTLVNLGKLEKPNRNSLIAVEGNFFSIQFDGFLRVEYEGRKEPVFFGSETRQINETSWIELKRKKILFSKDGFFINPLEAVLHGAYSSSGIGTTLPIDFKPFKADLKLVEEDDQTKFINRLAIYDSTYSREAIHINLEENAQFVPGASIAFDAYIESNNGRQDLSQVIYVELIGPDCLPVLVRKIRIANGIGSGAFILPTTLYSGRYVLVAYTSWMKNFDADFYYRKVIELGQRKKQEAVSINFFPEYGVLNANQENQLLIKTIDQNGLPVSGNVRLFDNTNTLIEELSTDAMGLGKVTLKAEENVQYYALLNESLFQWNLEISTKKDLLFSLIDLGEKIEIELENKLKEDRVIYVVSQSSGVLNYFTKHEVDAKEKLILDVQKESLGRGISQLSVVDESFATLRNQTIYVESNQVDLNNQADWPSAALHLNQNLADFTMLSWKEISDSKEALNKFLASHNWLQIDYQSIFNANFRELKFKKEMGLTISGKVDVKTLDSPKRLDLLVKSEIPQFIITQVEKDGSFSFNDVHYTDTTDLVFKLEGLLDTEFELTFDTVEYAYNPANYTFCETQESNDNFQDNFSLKLSNDVTVLDEVEVSTLRNLEKADPVESYTASKKSFNIESPSIRGNMVARGGVLRYMQTRITGSMLFRDRINGNVSGILLSRVASYDRSDVALLFYDDVEVVAEVFDAINPDFIERIDVLSGTEAAAYGFRGSKGVILAYSTEYLNTYNSRVKSLRLQDGYDVE